ncbi:PucR family transcriptional regulator [Taklimakanibacter deserti]|uniref:PucR family transcriptional regulator n=1 Tax=Taklimakanibacter deserti TaxID=2267839 RepID=UPI000E64AD30
MPGDRPSEYAVFRRTLERLAETGVLPAAREPLERSLQKMSGMLSDAVLAEVPAFSNSGNPDVVPELARHTCEHIDEIRRLFAGGEAQGFDFVKDHAHRRAAQRFPLEAILHAYRCGHRILSHWMRDAALASGCSNLEDAVSAVADFAIEYTDTVSSIVTAEYVDHTRALAEAEGDRRSELFNILLNGYDESDGRVARLLKRAGYLEQRQAYCIAVVQPVNAAEMENPARAERIADALSQALAALPVRMLVGMRNNAVVAVVSARRRQSGWTAPQADLALRIHPMLLVLGPAVLVGVSADHPSTSFLPKALHEATIALDFADVENRVVQFAGLPIRGLLVHRGTEYVKSSAPNWVALLVNADRAAGGALIRTLRALADADMNMQKAARILGKHPNTVYTRIERIRELTGLDGQRYHDLTELLLGADCAAADARSA